MTIRKTIALSGSLSLALVVLGCKSGPPPLTEEERALNAESFDQVWRTVKDQFYDPTLRGVDWEAARVELRPKAADATTMAEAREAMNELLGRLGESHFGIIPRDSYDDVSGRTGGTESLEGVTGIEARPVGGRALVWRVDPGSPADLAGIRPGWEIKRIGEREVSGLFEALSKLSAEDAALNQRFVSVIALNARLRGPIGSTQQVTFVDGLEAERVIDLPLAAPPGQVVSFGYLPPTNLTFSDRALASGVRYVTFNIFLDPVTLMPWFGEQVQAARGAPGMIIDLRGNPGGLGAMAMGMGGWFVTEPDQRLGTMTTRDAELKFFLNPRPDGFTGPLAVLIDAGSASTSEILAGGLQAIGRARVFGTTSAGAALPSRLERLANRDGLQYAIANYVDTLGRRLESNGVTPDEVVELDRRSLLEGRDPVVEAAERWILSRAGSGG